MKTFIEKEAMCEQVFKEEGPFWHLYTDGTIMENVFTSDELMKNAMTALAVETILNRKVKILTFEIMRNHIHLISAGLRDDILKLFADFKTRLIRVYRSMGVVVDWNKFQASIRGIETLKALRNEIVYVNRNAYVAYPEFTPFNYPWGGGSAYFASHLTLLPTRRLSDIGFNKSRQLTKFREVKLLGDLMFVDDIVFIPSFCRIDIGEKLFRDARSYFYLLTKSVEQFSQIAQNLSDKIFLIDEELFALATKYAADNFDNARLMMLTPEQKIQVAKELHNKYNATNQQLRRTLRLDLHILQELFPE